MRFYLAFSTLLLAFNAFGQLKFNELKYTGIGSYVMPAFHLLDDGSMIGSFQFHGGHEFCDSRLYGGTKTALVRFDKEGKIIWKKCYTKGSQKIVSITPYQDGTIACMGYSNKEILGHGRKLRFWIMLINAQGEVLKEYRVLDSGSSQESVFSASVTPDGGFIACGKVVVPSDYPGAEVEENMLIVKVSRNGILEWKRVINKAYWDKASVVVPSKFGGYIVGGWCQFKGDKKKRNAGTAWILRLQENGETKWEKNYGSGHYDYISNLIERDNGDIVFIGRETGREEIRHNGCGSQGFWIAGLNRKGYIKWENFMLNRATGTGSYTISHALTELEHGGFLVGGADVSDLRTSKLWLAEFGPEGELLDERAAGEKTCHGVYYIVNKNGKYLVAGWNQGYNTFKDGEFGIEVFDVWTMELEMEPHKRPKKPTDQEIDGEVHQTISYQEQGKDQLPHLFVQVHQPKPKQIHVYPNPAHSFVNIDLGELRKEINIQVFSMNGKLLLQTETHDEAVVQLNIGGLKNGTYLILLNADGLSEQFKFIKK